MEAEPGNLLELFIFLTALSSLEVVLGVSFVCVLLFCSALVSGSEVAFFSLTHNDFEKLQQEQSASGQRILLLKEKPRKLLATILISNNFINIAIVIVSDFLLLRLLNTERLEEWARALIDVLSLDNFTSVPAVANLIAFLLAVVGVTFLLVLFGEVAPKIYAKINNIHLAKFMSGPMILLMRIFHPISQVLVNWTTLIERRARMRGVAATSREDIDEAIELTVSSEAKTDQEIDILKSIVKFGDVSVKQIMRSRVDVKAVDFRINFSELLNLVRQSGFSRIPVYDNDFDNVTGILYVKDLLGHLQEPDDFEWQRLIRTNMLYVPEAKKIHDLLREFQRERLHMAIVVDEYGGSAGIVTLEDIMEEVIGEIKDEFDKEAEVIYRKIDDFNYLFEGKTLLNDVCRIIGVDTSTFDEVKGDADSLAGLVLELYGEIPKKDVEIAYNLFRFKIVSVSKRRIEQMLITLPAGE